MPGDPLSGLLGGAIAKVAVARFDAIVRALFAPIAKFITTQVIGWLITVPNLTAGNVSQLEQTVVAMGGGRRVRSRRSRSSATGWPGSRAAATRGFSALEGLARTVLARRCYRDLAVAVSSTACSLTNVFTGSLLASGAVVNDSRAAAGRGAGRRASR